MRGRGHPATVTDGKATVTRLVTEVMNGRDLDLLDELCTPQLAPRLCRAFTQFLAAFPDWRQEIVELVAEDHTVVARLRCSGTHSGTWQGLPPTGRAMRVDAAPGSVVDGASCERLADPPRRRHAGSVAPSHRRVRVRGARDRV